MCILATRVPPFPSPQQLGNALADACDQRAFAFGEIDVERLGLCPRVHPHMLGNNLVFSAAARGSRGLALTRACGMPTDARAASRRTCSRPAASSTRRPIDQRQKSLNRSGANSV
jgi:hypothetical protein